MLPLGGDMPLPLLTLLQLSCFSPLCFAVRHDTICKLSCRQDAKPLATHAATAAAGVRRRAVAQRPNHTQR